MKRYESVKRREHWYRQIRTLSTAQPLQRQRTVDDWQQWKTQEIQSIEKRSTILWPEDLQESDCGRQTNPIGTFHVLERCQAQSRDDRVVKPGDECTVDCEIDAKRQERDDHPRTNPHHGHNRRAVWYRRLLHRQRHDCERPRA